MKRTMGLVTGTLTLIGVNIIGVWLGWPAMEFSEIALYSFLATWCMEANK